MKALGILAGPRKGYTNDKLLDAALEGLKARSAEVEKLSLYDLDIKHCTGCNMCEKTRKCVIDDDHQMVLDKMAASDVIVFASPTYWSNVTGMAKAFFDRSPRFFDITKLGPKRLAEKPSKIILITSCGMPYPLSHLFGMATGCMRAMKVFFGYMAKAKKKCLIASGMVDYQKSEPSKRLLKKAYNLGKNI